MVPISASPLIMASGEQVQVFDADGQFLTKWGSKGGDDGQFTTPEGIAVDAAGNVYVADTGNDRVQVFKVQWRMQ